MHEFIGESTYFAVALSLICYAFAARLQRRFPTPFLNPLVVSSAAIIVLLLVLDIPNDSYQQGCQTLSYLLTPATICYSISFYEQFQKLKRHLPGILLGVLAGIICSLGSVYLLSRLFALEKTVLISLLPKSITTAIGVALSEEIGGLAAITTAAICITGNLGNMIGPMLCKLFRLEEPIAQGVAFGTSSHVIGTAKAMEINQLAGAVSSLSLTIAGLITTLLLSFLTQFLG